VVGERIPLLRHTIIVNEEISQLHSTLNL
jgi:hypothetical protein